MVGRLGNVVDAVRLLAGGRCRARGGIVLGYHDIVDDHARTPYDVPVDRFRMQMRALRRWGLQLVPLSVLVERVAAGEAVDGMVAVTFDDALEGVHNLAWPVLEDLGIPFTVFAVSDELGTDPAWWPDAGRIMTRQHLVELAAAGANIECHTRHHPSLPALDAATQRDETAGAKAALEDLTGGPVRLLAYPFGHHDRAVRAATADAGFTAGFSFLNGRVVPGEDIYRVPRFTMTSGHHQARLALHVTRAPTSWPDTQLESVTGE